MNRLEQEIRDTLYSLQDEKYRDFQAGLIPSKDGMAMIGVRTPALRKYAKELAKREDISMFLDDVPHAFFEENQLHAFIISEMKDYERCIMEVNRFLPYVDNWATCDQMGPKVFRKHRMELLEQIHIFLRKYRDKDAKNRQQRHGRPEILPFRAVHNHILGDRCDIFCRFLEKFLFKIGQCESMSALFRRLKDVITMLMPQHHREQRRRHTRQPYINIPLLTNFLVSVPSVYVYTSYCP